MRQLDQLTEVEISDAFLIFTNSIEETTKGIKGCAKVAKLISLAIDITFSDACILLDRLTKTFCKLQERLLNS